MSLHKGYISLHRRIMENPFYFSEPFCRQMAWVDLLLIANHKKTTFNVRGNIIDVPRGSLAYSQDTLAQRWRWSRGKVNRFLSLLKTAQQIELQKTYPITLIVIKNYIKYQDQKDKNGTTDGRQTSGRRTHSNNDNNDNKGRQNPSGSAPLRRISP